MDIFNSTSPNPKKKFSFLRLIKFVVFAILGLVLFLYLSYLFVFRFHKVRGKSMVPNFVSGTYIVSEKLNYYLSTPKRGDVVVFTPPTQDGLEFIARIVGLPGEKVSIKNGFVYINDQILNESYLAPNTKTLRGKKISETDIVIPDNEYFILGDNRSNSYDSRDYGFVNKTAFVGKVSLIYWPQDKIGFVKRLEH